MGVQSDFGSIIFFGTMILAVLTISGIKSGGPPFFRDELDPSLLGHVLDFQIWPAGRAPPSPAPKPENFRKFYEKTMFFATKLRESTGNRSQMFSGGVRTCATRFRACPRSLGLKNIQNSQKINNLRADSLLCLSWVMFDKRLILKIFHDFCVFFVVFVTKLHESTGNRSQMFSGGVGDVRDALSRVSALSGVGKPPKFTKNK